MKLRELIVKNTKKCDCGYEFSIKDITTLEKNNDYRYYGGRVEYYTKAKCPRCNKEVILFLEAYNNSYRVIDIAEVKNTSIKEIKEKEVIEGNICSNCKRSFKSQSGLRLHQRKCLKNK